ncbi:MAG: hypothetical protein GXP29_12510 [Planctomycetes bacterium]|nr:hypothetical protein [Planctomycetota bacterium]
MTAKRWMTLAVAGFAMCWTAGCETGPVGDAGVGVDTNDPGADGTGGAGGDNADGSTNDPNAGDGNGDAGNDAADNQGADDQAGAGGDNNGDDGNAGDNANTNGTPDEDVNTDGVVEEDVTDQPKWTQMSQPCGGTRANAFWFDDALNGYMGCGDNSEGFGLFVTSDGGLTWESQLLFGGVRINDIRRASNGTLYATGTDTVDSYEVFTIDESGPVRQLNGLYQSGNNAFTSVSQGENIAVTDDGQLFVDSLTGVQVAYRAVGAANFMELETHLDGSLTGADTPGEQMSRVVGFNNRFWAVGSLINQPGTVYYPSSAPGATYHMSKVEVQPSTRDGELHDIYLWSETSALVIGFDQSLRFPLIHSLNGDPSDAANWPKIDLFNSGITYQGGAWKMAVKGDEVVLVGQTFDKNKGFVLHSPDRGLTWTDMSPVDEFGDFAASLLTNVWFFDDGRILAAGEGGQLWSYDP